MELKNVLTEDVLMQDLGLTKSQVAKLRESGLTYIKVNRSKRLYDENDVAGFLEGLKTSRTPENGRP